MISEYMFANSNYIHSRHVLKSVLTIAGKRWIAIVFFPGRRVCNLRVFVWGAGERLKRDLRDNFSTEGIIYVEEEEVDAGTITTF